MTDPQKAFEDAATQLREAAEALDKATARVDDLPHEVVLPVLASVRESVATVRQCDAGMERYLAQVFDTLGWRDPQEIPGIGVVEVKRSTTRRAWRHDDAARDWLNAYMERLGGELPDPGDVLAAFRKSAQVNGWKVGGFKELGLSVNDYAHTEPGTPKVVITGGGS